MKKEPIILFAIALGLAATNWSSIKEFDRVAGTTSTGIYPVTFGLFFSIVAVWMLGRRAYRLTRELLDEGWRFSKKRRLFSIVPIAYLVPLLFHYNRTETSVLDDGTTLLHSYGYGTSSGWVLFLLGSAVFILFQVCARLERERIKAVDQDTSHNYGGSPASA